jgi:hypothetical protein
VTGQLRRGAAAGVVAAAAWAAGEPVLRRLARTPYSDVRLLGRAVTPGRGWPVVGLALHLANGALFGASFARLGLRGVRAGIIAAEAENLALWPGLLVVDRVHPDRRAGDWPPLARNPRVAAYAIAAHALFGFVLGRLTERPASRGSNSLVPRLVNRPRRRGS